MAETKHNLATKGAWVKLRAYDDLRAKHRKRALANRVGTLEVDPNTGKPLNMAARLAVLTQIDLAEDVAAMCVTAWNIPYLPGAVLPDEDPTILGELTMDDNTKLLELTESIKDQLLGAPKTVDPGDFGDPDSPSKPASV